jgi:xylulokinase
MQLVVPEHDRGRPITLVGGETRSEFWNQLKADVMGVPLRTTAVAEAATLGAAILAGRAARIFEDPAHAVAELVRFNRTYEPDSERHAIYRELREAHQRIFETVRHTYQSKQTGGPS